MLNPTPITVATSDHASDVASGGRAGSRTAHTLSSHTLMPLLNTLSLHTLVFLRAHVPAAEFNSQFHTPVRSSGAGDWTLSLVPRGHEQGRTRDGVFQSRSVVHIQCPCTYRSIPACPQEYFKAWNAHDKEAVKSLHAEESTLKDWDASHGPTNEVVATGIAGIWAAVPNIQIEIVSIFECGAEQSCVAQIKVVVDESTILNVCDVFTFDGAGKVVSIVAYKA